MKQAILTRALVLIVASALTACASPRGGLGGAIPMQLHVHGAASSPHPVLYVSDSSANAVLTFNPSNIAAGPTGRITSGINGPTALAVDPNGVLYVVNGPPANITLYKPGTSTPFKTITSKFGAPREIAIGKDDTIAVTFGGGVLSAGALVIWDKGSATPTRTIPIPLLQKQNNTALVLLGLFIDASDNIFASVIHYAKGPDQMLEFVPGSTHGVVTARSPDFNGGFDAAGNMYTGGGSGSGFVCLYAPSGKTCARRITRGLPAIGFFTVAADGTLFVPNGIHSASGSAGGPPQNGNVVLFAPGASAPTATFESPSLINPAGAALGFIP